MAFAKWKRSGTLNSNVSVREKKNSSFARKAAKECIVLLKNENILPLQSSVPISLLGIGADMTVKGGTGSGDVNNRENITIYKGLEEAGVKIVSKDWLSNYEERYHQARDNWRELILEEAKKVENPFDAYAANPFVMPEGRPVSGQDIQGATAAIYVISRISGEGKDRRLEKGDYYLSKREEEDILFLNSRHIPTILLINAGGPVELTDILEKAEYLKGVLNISQLGQEGGRAVADILLGKSVPCGKLTTTWARRYTDCPYAENYSYLNGNLEMEEYCEGIYVGYRYFDSFGVKPLFPFGFGLSYTSFRICFLGIRQENNRIAVKAAVENTGKDFAGKEIVQVYASLPQAGCEKEYHRLIGFAKTNTLKPGQREEMEVWIEPKTLASFYEEEHAWILENGEYGIWIGKSSAEVRLEAILEMKETVVLERTEKLEASQKLSAELRFPQGLKENLETKLEKVGNGGVPRLVFISQPENEAIDLPEKRYSQKNAGNLEMLAEKIPVEELIPLLYGNTGGISSNLGAAGIKVPGSAGETSEALFEKYQVPVLIMADGPAGIRLQQSYEVNREDDSVYGIGVLGSLENGFLVKRKPHENADTYFQYCTAFPVGTALAQSWNRQLLMEFGEKIADEMEEFGVNLWLAPGMNIHRNPLCGRNFEYYSEDPLLSGVLAAEVTKGVQGKKGCGVTIKHFACNNQEDNRMGVDVHLTERALREIYCRGFELAVKESQPVAIMSSYNLVNGVHAANSKDLCTRLARQEWGFNGVIMSDWNTTVPEEGSIPWKCAAAGNDIIMPGNEEDDKNIREAYREGLLSEKEIRECAARILRLLEKL